MDGIVRSFSRRHGYGFITPLIGDPNAESVYVHASALRDGLEGLPIGARVSFKLCDAPGGKVQAVDVVLMQLSGKALRRRAEGASLQNEPASGWNR